MRIKVAKDYKSELIWKTLQKNYGKEIQAIHELQYKDHQMYGSVQPATDRLLDELLDRVVSDNKKRREEEE